MLVFGSPRIPLLVRLLVVVAFSFVCNVRAQIIYDNTDTYLNNVVSEKREYGDQLDLGGVARRLTQIQFEYFGNFATNGDEGVKVRLYTNEDPYDRYRKAPTTLIYESDWIPITPGFQRRLVDGLNVLLPLQTVTFTAEFKGIATNEVAGLLFYGPPTEGYSFNEFWVRNALGAWVPILYSNTDPAKRANIGLRLIAVPDVITDQQQTGTTKQLAMRKGANSVRFAQTFTPTVSGQVSHLVLNTTFSNEPVRVRILDTIGGCPGPNVLATRNILSGGGTNQTVAMLSASVFLQQGRQYAIEFSTAAPASTEATYLIAAATNNYSRGELWFRKEGGGMWTPVSNPKIGLGEIDAAFQVHIIPAQPSAQLMAPRPSAVFDQGEPITLRGQHRPPEIGTIARMRFFRGTQEIGIVTNAPYEFNWTNAPAGDHSLRAVAEDTFRRPFRSEIVTVNVRPPGAPENDLFARRISLDGLSVRRSKPTSAATIEAGEPGLRPGNGAATVWWSWTAYDATEVTISAQNSSRTGAAVAVFTGTNLTTLSPVTNGTTLVCFDPEPGVTYAISVDPAVRGDRVTLDIATTDVHLEQLATNVVKASQPLVLAVTGSRAGRITNVNLFAGFQLIATSRTAPARWTNALTTAGFHQLRVVATDDRGIQTISGPVSLTMRPGNDTFAERTLLSGDHPAAIFHPGAGTLEPGEPALAELGYPERSSTWWSWTAPASGRVRVQVTSAGSAAAIAVFSGTSLSQLSPIAQNAGSGMLTFVAEAGRTYQIRVIGNYLDTESLRLSIEGDWVRLKPPAPRGTVTLTFDATPFETADTLRVEYSPDLIHWTPANTDLMLDRGRFTWRDASPPVSSAPQPEAARFYRIVRE